MKLTVMDFSLPALCFFLGWVIQSSNIGNGWAIASIGFVFIGLSILEHTTKCNKCMNDEKHTLPECFNKRLFNRGDKQ